MRFSGTCKRMRMHSADYRRILPSNTFFAGRRSAVSRLRLDCYHPIGSFSQKKNSMKCFVKWIPLRICVRSRNTQPYLKFSKASSSRCSELALENFHVNKDAATFLCRSKFSKVRCVVILCSQVRSKLALENLHFNKVAATCLSRRKILEIQQYNHFMLSI